MALPLNLLTHAEVQVHGLVSAAGVNSKNALFTFHYRRLAVINPCSETALDTIFQSTVAVPLFLALNNRILQKGNTVRFMDDPTRISQPVNHALVGGVSGDSMPTSNMVSTLYRSALRGKSYRGGNRFFPVSESDTTAATADILNAGSIALWAAFLAAVVTPLVDATSNTWVLCVYSRFLSKPTLLPQATIITNDVQTALLNKTVRKSKRRAQVSSY
jgi:hypothetical protein